MIQSRESKTATTSKTTTPGKSKKTPRFDTQPNAKDLIHLLQDSKPGRILENLLRMLMQELTSPAGLLYINPKSNSFLPELTSEGFPGTFTREFRKLNKNEIRKLLNPPEQKDTQTSLVEISKSPDWKKFDLATLPPGSRFCLTCSICDTQGKPWSFLAMITPGKFSLSKEQQALLQNVSRLMFLLRERQRDKRTIKSIKSQLSDEMHGQTQEMKEAIRQLQDEIVQRKIMERSLKTSNEKLQNLSNHLQKVREEERTRISREIHDELGQMLTTLKMKLSILEERAQDEHYPIQDDIQSMMTVAETTLQTVRRISTELRPGILDVLGLSEAVEWHAQEFQTQTKINIITDIERLPETIDKDIATTFFRICQEALTNVARHAKASRVMVSLKHNQGKLVLFVRDNGKGITNEQLSGITSLGLIGMRERAQNLGGDLIIQRARPKGTEVRISFPLDFAS